MVHKRNKRNAKKIMNKSENELSVDKEKSDTIKPPILMNPILDSIRDLKELKNISLDEFCRICKLNNSKNGGKMRCIFDDYRIMSMIQNTIHIKVKDIAGLPRYVCSYCVDLMKNFQDFQLNFRRSEEFYTKNLYGS